MTEDARLPRLAGDAWRGRADRRSGVADRNEKLARWHSPIN